MLTVRVMRAVNRLLDNGSEEVCAICWQRLVPGRVHLIETVDSTAGSGCAVHYIYTAMHRGFRYQR